MGKIVDTTLHFFNSHIGFKKFSMKSFIQTAESLEDSHFEEY